MEWKKTLLKPTATIEDAIKNLDSTASQIVLVVDTEERLIGIITDGDIRRGLLRGLTISSSIETIIHTDSLVVPPEMGRELVLQLMKANKIHQLPVVDKNRKIVGLHILDEVLAPSKKDNYFIIMAGGKGVRLLPYTENCPKPLLPVAGKPILEHIIEKAKVEGFTKFIIAIHYLGYMIEDYFEDGKKWEVEIQYIKEERPLGTAGALGIISQKLVVPFIVSNGDVMTDIRYSDLLDFHILHGAKATMAVRLYEWQHPFGVVHTKGVEIVGIEEKPIHKTHVNAGMYVLEPESLDYIQKNEYLDMPSLFSKLSEQNQRTIVYPMHEPWIDVGRPDDYSKVNMQKKRYELN